jgi:glyceraldehyde-3-phosphate dehydrogenase/erythrose-4-phosphate dehydrogenase
MQGRSKVTPQGLAYRRKERAMAVPKIAINGFGRIGRIVTRIAKMRRHFDVMDEIFVKGIAWYDNEWDYKTRIEELMSRLGVCDGMTSDFPR